MTPRRIIGLAEIAGRCDAFLLDQYGVLHDGERLYPHAADTVGNLAAAGKAVIVMTNSGRRSEANRIRLAAMGLDLLPSQVVSSGEVAYQGIADGSLGKPFSRGSRAFIIGKRGDDYGFGGLDLDFVASPEDSDFLLILGTNVPEWSLGDYRELLRTAVHSDIPALCCNPDIDMLTPSGIHPAPGAIARLYGELGGKVTFIGKPKRAIYDYAMSSAGCPPRDRTVAVGDSIAHDVAGARAAGISVGLVLTGLSGGLSDHDIARQCEEANAAPDWILRSLVW
jgi:HAD superfamily hydrolase (TIGR01459 family)